jgi:hypothetical protein
MNKISKHTLMKSKIKLEPIELNLQSPIKFNTINPTSLITNNKLLR